MINQSYGFAYSLERIKELYEDEPTTLFFMLSHHRELDRYISDQRDKVYARSKPKTAGRRGRR